MTAQDDSSGVRPRGAGDATVATSDLVYRQPGPDGVGFLAAPDGSGPRPGVVILHEAFGATGHVRHRATLLARAGYTALAADLFGQGRIPASREEAMSLATALVSDADTLVARVQAAVDALRAQPTTDASRVAVIGYCMGGTAALEYGRSRPGVAGIACFHGRLTTRRPLAAGEPAPPFLVCTGADDPLVPADHLDAFCAEMRGARADWQMYVFGGAGHAFTDPEAASLGMPGVAYHPATDQRSWRALLGFLDEVFTTAD